MLLVRKVIEHVYEKVLGQGSDAGSQSATAQSSAGGQGGVSHGGAASTGSTERSEEKEEDLVSIAEDKVELLCNNEVRNKIFNCECSDLGMGPQNKLWTLNSFRSIGFGRFAELFRL